MASYKRDNMTKEERDLLAALLMEDRAKAKDYLRLCRDCPIDGANEAEAIAREEAERKGAIADYLKGHDQGHQWNEAFITGYLVAYCMEKEKSLWQESGRNAENLAAKIRAKDGPKPTREEAEEANETARKALSLRKLAAAMPTRL